MRKTKLFLMTLLASLLMGVNAWGAVTKPEVTGTTLKAKEITPGGWYLFKYAKGPETVYSVGQYLMGYETAPVWNGSTTFIPCFTMKDYDSDNSQFAQCFIYIEPKVTSAGNGNQCIVQNSNGHYFDGSSSGSLGSTSRTSTSTNYAFLGVESNSADAKQRNVYFRTYNNGSNLAGMTLGGVKILGGTSNGNNLAFFNVVKVDLSACGLTAWKVSISGGVEATPLRGDTQIQYTGTGNYGHSKVYNNGTFFIDSSVTPTSSNFSVPEISGKSVLVVVNSSTHTIEVTYAVIDKQAEIEAANAVLAHNGVGYPAETSRTTLQNAITTFNGISSVTMNDVLTLRNAVTTFKNETADIQFPESGKVYQFVNIQYSGTHYGITYDANVGKIVTTTEDKTIPLLCQKNGDGTFTFRLLNGMYLAWRGNDSGGFTGVKDTYSSTWNNLKVQKIIKGSNSNVEATQEQLFGYVDYIGRRSETVGDKNEFNQTVIAKAGTFDQANVDFFKDSHSSAFLMNEAAGMHGYQIVLTAGSPENTALTFNDGTNTFDIVFGEDIPFIATTKTDAAEVLATLTARPGFAITASSVSGSTITLTTVSTAITYNVTIIPETLAGTGIVIGGKTYHNGDSFTFVGTPVWGTDISAVAVSGYEVVRHDIGETDVMVYYNRPKQILWESTSGDQCYRIPAIAQAGLSGKICAVTDQRPGKSDIGYGEVDICRKISTDNGVNWGTSLKIADGTGTSGAADCGFGDAAIAADRESDKMVLFCVNGNQPYPSGTRQSPCRTSRFESSDGGETWTRTLFNSEYFYELFDGNVSGDIKALFFGSGRIMQSRYVKVGSYYRLYAVLAARDNGNRAIYSDDFGQTWKPLGGKNALPCPNGDEPKAEELPDGRVLLSSRKGSGRYFNIYTFTNTATGEGYWQSQTNASLSNIDGLSASSSPCNGEILIVPVIRKADATSCYIALQSVPTGTDRSNVTIFYKELADADDVKNVEALATNWDGAYQVSNTSSAYSTMILQNDNNIGFFWENYYHNEGYDETYISLPMELITRNQYSVATEAHRLAFIQSTLPGVIDAMNKAGSYVGQSSTADIAAAKAPIASWTEAPTSAQLDAVFNIPSITIQAGNYYRFVNAYPGFETSQGHKKAIYNDGGLKWKQYNATDMSQVFRITSFENGVAKVIGVNDGFYPQAQTANDTAIPMSATENTLTVGNLATDQFSLKSKGSGNLFHCGGHNGGSGVNGNVVIWGGSANSCSAWYIEPVAAENVTFPITVSAAGYATYASAVDLTLPAEVEAYCATEQQVTGNVVMTRIEGEVPANEGVVLKAAAGNYTLKAATEATALETNYLKAAVTSTTIEPAADHKAYIFANGKNGVGFYILDSSSSVIAAHKSWLELPEEKATKGFIGFDDPTGIESIHNAEFIMHNNGKFLENGKIVIVKNNAKYNVAGQSIK